VGVWLSARPMATLSVPSSLDASGARPWRRGGRFTGMAQGIWDPMRRGGRFTGMAQGIWDPMRRGGRFTGMAQGIWDPMRRGGRFTGMAQGIWDPTCATVCPMGVLVFDSCCTVCVAYGIHPRTGGVVLIRSEDVLLSIFRR